MNKKIFNILLLSSLGGFALSLLLLFGIMFSPIIISICEMRCPNDNEYCKSAWEKDKNQSWFYHYFYEDNYIKKEGDCSDKLWTCLESYVKYNKTDSIFNFVFTSEQREVLEDFDINCYKEFNDFISNNTLTIEEEKYKQQIDDVYMKRDKDVEYIKGLENPISIIGLISFGVCLLCCFIEGDER